MTPYSIKTKVINPKTKKSETKTEWTSNAEQRENFLNQFKEKGVMTEKARERGEKRLSELALQNKRYADWVILPFPEGFTWLFNHFYKIWKHCETDINGNRIFTPRQISDYCECFGVPMNYHERKFVLQMKEWAVEAIAELKKEHED